MKKLFLGILGGALLIGAAVAPSLANPIPAKGPAMVAQAGIPDHVHRIHEGIRHLRYTHAILDSEAGTNFGGHREAAEQNINQAINDCQQAIEFALTKAGYTGPEPVPPADLIPEPAGGDPDHVRRLRDGLAHLRQCHKILDAFAGTDFGGHREQAEQAISQAENNVQQAIAFFQQDVKHHH